MILTMEAIPPVSVIVTGHSAPFLGICGMSTGSVIGHIWPTVISTTPPRFSLRRRDSLARGFLE